MTADKEIDQIKEPQTTVEEQKPIVEFPKSTEELKSFLSAAEKAGASSEKTPDEKKGCVFGIYLEPGTTMDVDKDCNFKIRPMTKEERDADTKRREYEASPQGQKDRERILREFR
ncbi:MAG: hypothetical protein K2X77_25735 [Candidatus Obscuribacterales bacterium]|nr:hypothetical protein [Candidatus Obscuribacterales bacterium]